MSFNRDAYLMHYNHNHDRLGRFARSVGSAGGKVGSSVMSSGKKKKKGQPPEADIKKGKAANTKLSDKDRKRIVDSGDAKEVAKYKDRLSTRELEAAVNRLQKEKVQRIDLEKKLSDLNSDGRDKQRATAIDKIEKYGNDLERISNGLEKAAKMYNTAAKIHNLMSSGNDQWPIYGEKKSKDKSAKEKELIERGEKLKERNLKTKENKSKREEREEAFASRKLDDAEADYDREREKKARQERLSKIQIQTYNPDNEEGTYYSDKIYDYSADGEGKYYTERDYEKKKKLRHDDLVEAGENFLAHYNHNHDKLGRFARSNGNGAGVNQQGSQSADKKQTKQTKQTSKQEHKNVSTQNPQENHNNSVDKLSRDSNGVLSGNINFGSSDDCQVYINDDSKKGHDLYNKISNDSRFEDEARKYVAEELYGMYRGWDNSWDESSKNNVKEQLKASKDDIYKNTKCDQLQIEGDYDGADILLVYKHKYGPSDYDYERWLVTYDSKKKKFIESQPW